MGKEIKRILSAVLCGSIFLAGCGNQPTVTSSLEKPVVVEQSDSIVTAENSGEPQDDEGQVNSEINESKAMDDLDEAQEGTSNGGSDEIIEEVSNEKDSNEGLETENTDLANDESEENVNLDDGLGNVDVLQFSSLSSSKLRQYMEDEIYAQLSGEFASEDYIIENISTVYYSKEYLEEVAYNSEANIYFGYTLKELEDQFQGEKYVFTLGDDGNTIVVPFEGYDDTYEKAIKNVAIGSGVILICVTVSVVSGGLGSAPICTVMAASAKTGTIMALSSGTISAVVAGAVTGVQTKDCYEVTVVKP